MNTTFNAAALTASLLFAFSAAGQQPSQPTAPAANLPSPQSQPDATDPASPANAPPAKEAGPPATQPPPPILSHAVTGAWERRDSFTKINVYLPEGQASVRLRKLIRNVLFESQIDYRFVNGDVSTYLRYKYYARNFTYRLGVFDQIGFPDVGSKSTKEFERVRGGLLLFEFPRTNNTRYYWLLQDDRLTFGDTRDVDNRKNNIYTKVGYQFGTQFDERLNAIGGESRGRITPVLTAFRDLGTQRFSLAAAVTESARVGTGDYKYTKLEAEAVRRTDLTETSFLVTRLHAGAFAGRGNVSPAPVAVDLDGDGVVDPVPRYESYTIPRYELFGLGGREALRSVRNSLETQGTDEVHLTNEVFVPLFRNRDIRTWVAHWNTLYGITYLGAGTIAFDARDVVKSGNAFLDAGLGAEAAVTVREFEVILSVLYAHAVKAPDGLKRGKVSFSIRTVR